MEPSKVAQSVDDIVPLRAILRERALLIPRGWLVVQSAAGGVQMVFALVQRPHRWATFVLGGACLVLLAVWSLAEQRIAFSEETAESGPSR